MKSLLICFALLISAQSQKCRILAMQGGGDKGSFQAGVLHTIFNTLPTEDVAYDVISGVSAGSINAGGFSMFAKGAEKEAVEWMVGLWSDITQSDVFVNYPEGPVLSFFGRPSIFNTNPLRKFFQSHMQSFPKRKLNIGTVDANKGTFVRLNETQFQNVDDFIEAIMTSSAMPSLFPYQNAFGSTFIDGGSMINIDLIGGIQRCQEEGFADQDIIVDAVLCEGIKDVSRIDSKTKTIQIFYQENLITSLNVALRDIRGAVKIYKKVQFRYLFSPLTKLPWSFEPINFNHEQIMKMIETGKQDAMTVINMGEGVSFQKYLQNE